MRDKEAERERRGTEEHVVRRRECTHVDTCTYIGHLWREGEGDVGNLSGGPSVGLLFPEVTS